MSKSSMSSGPFSRSRPRDYTVRDVVEGQWVVAGQVTDNAGNPSSLQVWSQLFTLTFPSPRSIVLVYPSYALAPQFPLCVRVDRIECVLHEIDGPQSTAVDLILPTFNTASYSVAGTESQVGSMDINGSWTFPPTLGVGIAVPTTTPAQTFSTVISETSVGSNSSTVFNYTESGSGGSTVLNQTGNALNVTLTGAGANVGWLTSNNGSGVLDFDTAATVSGTDTTTGSLVLPSFAIGTVAVTVFTISATQTNYFANLNWVVPATSTMPSTDVTGLLTPQSNSSVLMLALYVADQNQQTGAFHVRDPFNVVGDAQLEYLALETDVYVGPTGAFGYTGRRFSVSLPYPIIIGPNQALILTLSGTSALATMNLVPYVRSLVTVLS